MTERRSPALEVFLTFLRLGCTSFGGPIAHLGYFRAEFVERRRWLSDAAYAELIGLAQSMPGPASSQVGFAIGLLRGGWPGGLAAWTGFTLPSAALMLAFAFGEVLLTGRRAAAILHGLELVAVAVVAQAVLSMRRTLAPDFLRIAIAALGFLLVLISPPHLPPQWGTLLAIAVGALAGLVLLRRPRGGLENPSAADRPELQLTRRSAHLALALFVALLALSVLPARTTACSLLGALLRTGALVFGGGHVVLPLLASAIAQHHWLSQPAFLAGYGAAQALPGPLFSIGAYVGAAARPSAHPLLLGLAALVALFLPGLLLMAAVLPYWSTLRQRPRIAAVLGGINASVVGVLAAALYQPLLVTAVHTIPDVLIAATAFLLLVRLRTPPWAIVLGVTALSTLLF
jgi:chromate transporter